MRTIDAWAAALTLAGCTAASSPARAQEQPDTFRLHDIVVTATRLATPIANAPGSVTVLEGEALRLRGVRTVADALRSVPGVAVLQGGGPGGITSVFVRGGESDYTQVLVDGVQANIPGGQYNWAHLRTEDIERIEIVRGPAGVLYGSDAVSGVVQIFTRAGGAPRLSVALNGGTGRRPFADAGRHHSLDLHAALTGAAALADALRVEYGGNVVRAASDGLYAYNSDYHNTTLSGKLWLRGARGDLGVVARAIDGDYHYPTSGSGAVADSNQYALTDTRTLALDGGVRLLPALELRALATVNDNDTRTEDPADHAADGVAWSMADQLRRTIDVRANWFARDALALTLGAEHEWQDDRSGYRSVSAFGTFADSTDNSRTTTGIYGQVHGTRGGLAATAGARIDESERFGTFTTGRAALSWRATTLRLHGAAGTAFKEPTFFENFAVGYTRGNPELEPEQSFSWEAGAEYAALAGAATLGVTWFDQRFRNLIEYHGSAPRNTPHYRNVGAATARGLEATARAVQAGVTLHGSYTYTRTEATRVGAGGDPAFMLRRPLLRRPAHQGALGVTADLTATVALTADVLLVGERADLDFTDPQAWNGKRVTLPAHGLVNAAASWQARPAVEVRAAVRNLLDADHAQIFNFPGSGRLLELGVRGTVGF